jgi:hypothetical protein
MVQIFSGEAAYVDWSALIRSNLNGFPLAPFLSTFIGFLFLEGRNAGV